MRKEHVMTTLSSDWVARFHRYKEKSAVLAADATRSIEWHIGGGKRYFNRYFDELVSAHKWCFIVGCNNSGTSILQRVLENTGQVSTLPMEGQMYTRIFRRARKRGHERVWSEYLDDLVVRRDASKERARRLLFDWMRDLQLPIAPVIVEKTPANVARMRWIDSNFPTAHFIGLVRDGYAVCEGIKRKGRQPIAHAAKHWAMVNEIMLEESCHVRNYLRVSYEDITDDPEQVSTRIAEFLNLDKRKISESFRHKYQIHNMADGRESAVVNYNSESIKRLSQDEINLVEKIAAETLNKLGYAKPVR
ncbi:sulfotransferase [Parasulfuritortus cantonensis]|uniref:Sulfotransferase n=1 Tax=Parasulfuritortus cantonensis TaxID=2528202 RepID=A0A4R1BKS6_9PROT|nr:sulfotransferase [Parasulfuritortus cantonensis]TCJ17936.1 sulfotransferase [Parasulfuritortus cantonensis]